MRGSSLLAVGAAVALSLSALQACGGDDDSVPPDETADGAAPPGADATASATDGGGVNADASTPNADATTDVVDASPLDGADDGADASADAPDDGDSAPSPDATADATVPSDASTPPDAATPLDATSPQDAAPDAAPVVCTTPIVPTGSTATAFQVDPAHTGAQPGDQLALPLCPRWTYDFGQSPGPALVGQYVFVASIPTGTGAGSGHVTALDKTTGKVAWGPEVFSSYSGTLGLALDGNVLIVQTGDGYLTALDASDGLPLWTVDLGSQTSQNSPVALNGIVYAGAYSSTKAVRESDGVVLWTKAIYGGSAAIASGAVYFGTGCSSAASYNATSGALLWTHTGRCSGGTYETPTAFGTSLFVRDNNEGNATLNLATGALVGTFPSTLSPAFSGTTMVAVTNGVAVAAPVTGGPEEWSFGSAAEPVVIAPIIVGSNVVLGTAKGVYVRALADGRDMSSVAVAVNAGTTYPTDTAAAMSAGDGRVFVPSGTKAVAF